MTAYRYFLLGSKIAPVLPVWLGNALCDLIGLVFYWVARARRQAVMSNLSHALADRSVADRQRVARGIFRHTIRNYYDLLRAYKIPQSKLDQLVEVTGVPEAKALSARNGHRGIIMYSGHVGSFSLASQVSTKVGMDFYLTVEPIKPPELFELVRKLREIDPRTQTVSVASAEIRQIFRAFKNPEGFVCMAIDRDVIGTGQFLDFFGAPAKLPLGAAEIALKTGCLLMPVHVYRRGNQDYRIDVYHDRAFVAESTGDKTADIRRTAQRMLAEVETIIRKTPEQWAVLQPIWEEQAD